MLLDKLLKIEENWVVFYDLFSKNGNGDSIRPIAEELKKGVKVKPVMVLNGNIDCSDPIPYINDLIKLMK